MTARDSIRPGQTWKHGGVAVVVTGRASRDRWFVRRPGGRSHHLNELTLRTRFVLARDAGSATR